MPKPSNIEAWKGELERPDPMKEAYDKNKMDCNWLAKGLKSLTRFKAETELKNGEIKKLSSTGAARVRKDAFELSAEIAGWKKDKVEHTGTIIFESNVPEPDPLPEEEDA